MLCVCSGVWCYAIWEKKKGKIYVLNFFTTFSVALKGFLVKV